MDPDVFSKHKLWQWVGIVNLSAPGMLVYFSGDIFFIFCSVLKMNLFWTIWKKSLVRSQPNHQASKKASKNVFLFLSLIKRAELSLSLWEGTSAIDVWSEPLFFWFHTNDRPADTDGHGEYTMKHVQEISVENKRAVCLTWVLYRARSF